MPVSRLAPPQLRGVPQGDWKLRGPPMPETSEQPFLPSPLHEFRLWPPLGRFQIFENGRGGQVARAQDNQPAGVATGTPNVELPDRRPALGEPLMRTEVAQLEGVIRSLLDGATNHVGKTVLHIGGGGHRGPEHP